MPLRIVERYPRAGVFRRFVRTLLFLLGAVLTLGGLAAAAIPLLLGVALIFSLLIGEGPQAGMDSETIRMIVVPTAIALVGLPLGRRLLRGRRRLVLFLRRFGFADSSEALTFAVGTAVGRRWRVVTLDDSRLVPVGVKSGVRRTFRLGRWIGVLILVIGLVWGYLWLTGEAPDELFDQTFDDAFEAGSGNVLERFVGAMLGSCLLTFFVVGLLLTLGLLALAFVSTLTLFTWGAYRAVRKAEGVKAREILEERQIHPTTRAAARMSRRLFAPRLMVVRVAQGLWKQAVLALADAASVVLIDISDPTANLVWEIETLRAAARSRWLLVGRRDRLEALARGGDSEAGVRLALLLDDEEALAYAGEEEQQMRQFAKSLGGRLQQIG